MNFKGSGKYTKSEIGMYGVSSQKIVEFAKELRKNMTETEVILWEQLRKKQLGYKFRRQHPYSKFILDFFCYQKQLAIEIDGKYHEQKQQKYYDEWRTKCLVDDGITELRFTNDEIKNDLGQVIRKIKETLELLN